MADEPKVEKPKKETVLVNKEELAAVLERLKTLEAVADKSRLEWYRGANPNAKKETVVSVGTYPTSKGYKVITGWPQMPVNEMYQDTNSAWHERQTMTLFLEGDEKLDINYVDFSRRKVSVKAKVLSRSKDEESGTETLKLELEDGKKVDVDSIFVNV